MHTKLETRYHSGWHFKSKVETIVTTTFIIIQGVQKLETDFALFRMQSPLARSRAHRISFLVAVLRHVNPPPSTDLSPVQLRETLTTVGEAKLKRMLYDPRVVTP